MNLISVTPNYISFKSMESYEFVFNIFNKYVQIIWFWKFAGFSQYFSYYKERSLRKPSGSASSVCWPRGGYLNIYICKYSSDLCTLLYVYYTRGGIQQTITTIFLGDGLGVVYTHAVHTHSVCVYGSVCTYTCICI